MAKCILLRVVDPTLANELWTQPHVFAMMSSLRSRFTTFRKAHILWKWRELSRIPVDMHCNPAVVATQYKHCLAELLDMDVWINIDNVGPLMFHDAIAQGTPLRAEFDQRINAAMVAKGYQPISFEKTWKICSAAILQVQAVQGLEDEDMAPATANVAMHIPKQHEHQGDSIISSNDNIYITVDAARPAGGSTSNIVNRQCF
ncbi:hypothetical protein PCANC_25605 [Puccinia coronata f. sp. avenae]|uniref:Uncharacterized protein n=1 Tax=Puccinia coronata f. sp. avenae TaxID=200324 RepID=A0A2N5S277_9BASI|nr:hypothetical protein PCANC_25605 [Puccinia coronata f. sp. avenae]